MVGRAEASSLRVIVADDDASVRNDVRRALAEATDLELVGTTRDGAEAWNAVHELRPDVVVLDDEMPTSGLDVAARLRTELPELRIVMYVAKSENCLQALSIGATACVSKARPLEELLIAIRGLSVDGSAVSAATSAPKRI